MTSREGKAVEAVVDEIEAAAASQWRNHKKLSLGYTHWNW
jgi:hypothetical protein